MRETLGQYLRREREARNISLDELSKGTRMNKSFLEALEKDDLGFFPQRDFVIGFLKCYTRYLGLPPDEALKRYLIQAELESRKIDFWQLSLFPNFAGNQKEKENELLNKNGILKRVKISKWVFIQGAITLVALGASFYIQQILKQTDLPSKPLRNESMPSLISSTSDKKELVGEKKEQKIYWPEKTNSQKKGAQGVDLKSTNIKD